MAATPLRVLLFVAGALVAAVGTAYFAGGLDPYLGRVQPDTVADREAPAASGEGATGEAAQEKAAAPEATGKESEIAVPSFDIVRVEPDGSMVIAGAAEPGSQVEVVAGATVLGTAVAGPSGDFAVVLDEPLGSGDYQIVLRSTASDNVAATSIETAIVSVPDDESGQVLALVEQPGQPSRLITKPEPEAPEGGSGEMASKEQGGDETTASREPASEDVPEAAMADTTEKETAETAGDIGTPASESTAEPAATAQAKEAAAPEEQAADASEADQAESETRLAAGSEEPEQAQQREQKPAPAGTGAAMFIEAVEIDGRQVFVAGMAEPGSRVRVYANDVLLGEATTSPGGRFLVEATRDLPQGDYIVRADMLSDDGAAVVARAAVPFVREAGEKFSAVAPKGQEQPSATAPGSETVQEAPETAGAGTPASDETQQQAAAIDAGSSVSDAQATASRQEPTASDQASQRVAAAVGDGRSGGDIVTAPKLEPVDGAVIIRRGDTLWHISRRVYGRGIRYTTIYLANQDQIHDPDRIWPGQVFAVPEKTDEGESADMSAIGEQAVPVPE